MLTIAAVCSEGSDAKNLITYLALGRRNSDVLSD